MHTIEVASPAGGRRRRNHSAEFKAQAVEACKQPGVSMASVALANGINANLLRRWVIGDSQVSASTSPSKASRREFIALPLPAAPAPSPAADVRVEVRRGSMTVNIAWPVQAAGDCAVWLRELLR